MMEVTYTQTQPGLPPTKANLGTPEFLNHKKREKGLTPDMVTCLKNPGTWKPINYI